MVSRRTFYIKKYMIDIMKNNMSLVETDTLKCILNKDFFKIHQYESNPKKKKYMKIFYL